MNVDDQHFLSRLLLQPMPSERQQIQPHLRQAAVMIPLVQRAQGLHVVLTQRSFQLRHHPGQICFPGGRFDAEDQTLQTTAIRETSEELGILRRQIEVYSELPMRHTLTGFHIQPFIGLIHPPLQYQKNEAEVLEIFELPLKQLLHFDVYKKDTFIRHNTEHEFIALTIDHWFIWGATARILYQLMNCMR